MAFQLSPGVNVSEIDLTTIVPAVATTEGAIAGVFRWGPTNERVLISSEQELVNTFGEPFANTTWTNAETFFSAANFLGYSDALYVTRVTANSNPGESTNFIAAYDGALGNSIEVAFADATEFAGDTTSDVITVQPFTSTGSIETVANTGPDYLTVGDKVVLGDQELIITDIGIPEEANTVFNTTVTFSTQYTGVSEFAAGFTYTWGYAGRFDRAPDAGHLHVLVIDKAGAITGVAGTIIERFSNLSKTQGAKLYDGTTNFITEVLENRSSYIRAKAALVTATGKGYEALVGGEDGDDEADIALAALVTGYDLYNSSENVDISLIIQGKPRGSVLANYIIQNVAEKRRDCVAFISPEVTNSASYTAQELVNSVANITSSSYAVVDSGYKYQYDKYADVYRWIPMNADVAGLCARTDDQRDPWFSPAGYNRGIIKNVVKLALNPSKAARDLMYKNGINPILTQPGQGTVLFGDKTFLSQPSAFDRINVRRLFIVLEKSIAIASRTTLFEFNDEFTRAQFKNLVEPFLRDVQGRRGIFDFRVICDGTNNTPEVIDRNEFIGDIYVRPARSINFIQLNFVAVRSGVEFEEIVGQA